MATFRIREAASLLGVTPAEVLAEPPAKSTNVSVEIPNTGPARSSRPAHPLAVLRPTDARAAGPTGRGQAGPGTLAFKPSGPAPIRLAVGTGEVAVRAVGSWVHS